MLYTEDKMGDLNASVVPQIRVPLRSHLGALYEHNIAAKILKTAIDGLESNVSDIFCFV